MYLTTQQKQTLKTWLQANAQALNDQEAADALNAAASPAYTVWKSNVTQDQIMQNGFDWTEVDNLSVGKARIWEWMFQNETRSFNPSKSNVRAGIAAVWKGSAPALAVQAAVLAHCKRSATVAEKLLATGTGTDVSPATMGAEGDVTAQNVIEAYSA